MLGTYPTAGMAEISNRFYLHIVCTWQTYLKLKYTAKNVLTQYGAVAKMFCYGIFSELNLYRSSIRTVSDQYACIRPI